MSTRRRIGLSLFLFGTILWLCGCTTTWVGEATGIINALLPAVTQILGLIVAFGAKGVTPTVIQQVTNIANEATNDLQNVVLPLINQYNAAASAAKPGILSKIDAAVKTVMANFSQILPALHIDDLATQAKIEAVIGAVEGELQDLLNLIPVIQGTKALHDVTLPLNAKQFTKHFNQIMAARTGNPEVDAIAAKFVVPAA